MRNIFILLLVGVALAGDFVFADDVDPVDCTSPPETGPCRAMIPSFYFNATLNACMPFVYGGCLGNINRFPTCQTCIQVCGEPRGLTTSICDPPNRIQTATPAKTTTVTRPRGQVTSTTTRRPVSTRRTYVQSTADFDYMSLPVFSGFVDSLDGCARLCDDQQFQQGKACPAFQFYYPDRWCTTSTTCRQGVTWWIGLDNSTPGCFLYTDGRVYVMQ